MKIRVGFVSNSSSSSFVLKKDYMGDEEIKDFQEMRAKADMWDTIGETESFFFGVVDYSNEFCQWLERKNFIGIQWG